MKEHFTASYWQHRYNSAQTGWDVGNITGPLKDYFNQLVNTGQRILIPGCGNAYEAEYLFKLGYTNIYLLDIAEAPIRNFAERVPDFPESQLLLQNFFQLEGSFDLLVEQAFFCAIDPALRPAYAKKAAELLKPGGKLVGVLFDTTFQHQGPPFGGSKAEYAAYFAPYFDFIHFEQAYNSIKPREGRELFICLQKK